MICIFCIGAGCLVRAAWVEYKKWGVEQIESHVYIVLGAFMTIVPCMIWASDGLSI